MESTAILQRRNSFLPLLFSFKIICLPAPLPMPTIKPLLLSPTNMVGLSLSTVPSSAPPMCTMATGCLRTRHRQTVPRQCSRMIHTTVLQLHARTLLTGNGCRKHSFMQEGTYRACNILPRTEASPPRISCMPTGTIPRSS